MRIRTGIAAQLVLPLTLTERANRWMASGLTPICSGNRCPYRFILMTIVEWPRWPWIAGPVLHEPMDLVVALARAEGLGCQIREERAECFGLPARPVAGSRSA